jgi:hypothetical protein
MDIPTAQLVSFGDVGAELCDATMAMQQKQSN